MTIQEINKNVAEKMSKIGIHHINMVAVGNSISSGYSMLHAIKPLLTYNETLADDIEGLTTYHFARAQDNCDIHIYKWLQENYSLQEIYKLNRRDYGENQIKMPLAVDDNGNVIGMTKEKMDQYYPLSLENYPHFKDLIAPQKDTANIIVYHGGTGSFLDNVTRNGCHKLTYGIKKDIGAIDSFMEEITLLNERDISMNPTQVYLCGAPEYDIPVSEFINTKLRTISKRHPHVTYIKPVKCHLIQKGDNNKLGVDFHYSKQGYFTLNYKIMFSILNHYVVSKSVIHTANKMREENKNIFFQTKGSPATKEDRQNIFDNILLEQVQILENLGEDSISYLKKMKQEIKENRAHEYFTLLKETKPLQSVDSIIKKKIR